MILGADTLVPVTDSIVASVRKKFGTTPLFWGRYFKRPGFKEDYQPQLENRVFNDNAIRLLPIARQTNRVAGTATQGAEDALLNVDAYTTSLTLEHLGKVGGELLMFLDVEGTSASHPNLSLEYWIGWSSALVSYSRRVSGGDFVVIPAVYCRQNQNPTWDVIARAAQLGFPCAGAWVFRMRSGACDKPIPTAWDAPFNTPSVTLPCPIMLHQFAIDCVFQGGVDFNMVNPDPAVAAALLNRLVFP
ncbi:MAG TPA: hypothetical protein VF883_07780 [Thermoanaerobaculia bacterium]|jgi:hypothetical protein